MKVFDADTGVQLPEDPVWGVDASLGQNLRFELDIDASMYEVPTEGKLMFVTIWNLDDGVLSPITVQLPESGALTLEFMTRTMPAAAGGGGFRAQFSKANPDGSDMVSVDDPQIVGSVSVF